MEKGTIPKHCEEIKSEHGVMHLWDEAVIIKSIDAVKNYKRGQQITKAQKKYNQARVKQLKVIDRFASTFKLFLDSHVHATPSAEVQT